MSCRVLHIIDSLGYSGAARQLAWLAPGLAEQGFDVHVCALARGGPLLREVEAAGIPVVALGRRWTVDPVAFGRLALHLARLRPKVVQTWDHASGLYGRLAAVAIGGWGRANSRLPAGSREPTNGRPVLIAGLPRSEPRRGPLKWLLQRKLVGMTDLFLVPDAVARDRCIDQGLPTERIVMVSGGVPGAPVSDVPRDELLRELSLPACARLIGVVSRLAPDAGVKELIWAADLVRVLHDNVRLLVIGDGPDRPQLERFARLASDLEHIRFLGWAELRRILPHLDVLWCGSEQAGYATAIMAAMAAGVPVVASDVPGHRRLIVEGESGYLVPIGARAALARATDRLLTDNALAARIGSAASERVHGQFSVAQFVRQCAELYQRFPG